jgi:hypothetical protein
MSIWNKACDILKSIEDDEDEVEKAAELTERQMAGLGVAPEHGAKALSGKTLKKVEGSGGKGLVHSRPGKLTIGPAPSTGTPTSRQKYLASPFKPTQKR